MTSSGPILEKSKVQPRSRNCTRMGLVLFLVVIFVELVPSSEGCYLKNCPLGKREGKMLGKRSGLGDGEENFLERAIVKSCPRCGPGGLGQCIGPSTCCVPNGGGCLLGIGLRETAVCAAELTNPVSCIPDSSFARCELNGEDGVCANDGVCCTEDECGISSACLPPPPSPASLSGRRRKRTIRILHF